MSLRGDGHVCPYCQKLVLWFTAGGHHPDQPLGLASHRCGSTGRKVYHCSYCGRVRSLRCSQ